MKKEETYFGEALNKTQISENDVFSQESATEICGGWEKLLIHIKKTVEITFEKCLVRLQTDTYQCRA